MSLIDLKEIELKIKNSKVKLLGQIEISDKEYDLLIKNLKIRVDELSIEKYAPVDINISMALVQIAIREYAEGKYWDCLEDLNINISQSKKNYLGRIFLETIKMYDMFIIENKDINNIQIVENIKAHSFIPNKYMNEYFEFLFSFYDRNLFRQLNYEIEKEIEDLKLYIDKALKKNNSIKLQNIGKRTAKTYKLLNATKFVIAQNEGEFIKELILPHLKIIDDYYYDNIIPKSNDRYAIGFVNWINNRNENSKPIRKKFRAAHNYFCHKPYLIFDNRTNCSELIIPEQKFFNENILSDNRILINNKNYKFDLFATFGGIASEIIRVKDVNLFEEYNIKIPACSKDFNIPPKNYRIFNSEWIEIPKLIKGECNILIKKGSNIKIENAEDIHKESYKNILKYELIVNDSTYINIDGVTESILGDFEEKTIFNFVFKEYKVYEDNELEKEIQSCWKHPIIRLSLNNNIINGCILKCNDRKFRISDISNISDLDENSKKVDIYLENILEDKDGKYEIYLLEPSKNKRLLTNYLLISKLRFRTEKPMYIYSDEAKIYVDGTYNIEEINSKKLKENEYIFNLKDDNNIAIYKISLNEKNYFIEFPIKVFKYCIDDTWNISKPNYVWYEDLRNELLLEIPGCLNASLYLDKDKNNKIKGNHIDKDIFKFDITEFIHKIKEEKKIKSYVNLQYYDGTEKNIAIFKVLKENLVNKIELIKDSNNNVSLDVEFIGNNDLCIDVKDRRTKEIIIEKRKLINGLNDMSELKLNKLYTIEIYDLIEDDFGFSSEYRFKFYINKIGAINYDNISNCNLFIKNIIFENINLILKREYVIFNLKKVSNFEYIGQVKFRNINKNNYNKYFNTNINVKCTILDDKKEGLFIESYSDDVSNWCDIYYDKKRNILVNIDDDILYESSKKHGDRFITLYMENTEYKIDIRREK